ncbi:MAG: hypothetical protein ACX94C_11780 [Phycisphaerales bacterium]
MPTLEWRGGGTTPAFSDKTNWIDSSTGGTPASAPANGDTLIFNQGAYDVPGAVTGLSNITMIGTTNYNGAVGTTTALDIDLASLDWEAGGITLSGDIDAASVMCKSASFAHSSGTVADIYFENTDYDFSSDSVVTALRALNSHGNDQNNGTGYTLCEVDGGQLTTRRSGAPKTDNGARIKVAKGGTLLDGTDIAGRSTLLYESSEDIASSQEIIVRAYSTLSVRASSGFAWDGELTDWKNSNVDLNSAGGLIVPDTRKTYGRSQGVGGPVMI